MIRYRLPQLHDYLTLAESAAREGWTVSTLRRHITNKEFMAVRKKCMTPRGECAMWHVVYDKSEAEQTAEIELAEAVNEYALRDMKVYLKTLSCELGLGNWNLYIQPPIEAETVPWAVCHRGTLAADFHLTEDFLVDSAQNQRLIAAKVLAGCRFSEVSALIVHYEGEDASRRYAEAWDNCFHEHFRATIGHYSLPIYD